LAINSKNGVVIVVSRYLQFIDGTINHQSGPSENDAGAQFATPCRFVQKELKKNEKRAQICTLPQITGCVVCTLDYKFVYGHEIRPRIAAIQVNRFCCWSTKKL
jgi:hypothetical protein